MGEISEVTETWDLTDVWYRDSSNILNDPPHKILSKKDKFWMYHSQIISLRMREGKVAAVYFDELLRGSKSRQRLGSQKFLRESRYIQLGR